MSKVSSPATGWEAGTFLRKSLGLTPSLLKEELFAIEEFDGLIVRLLSSRLAAWSFVEPLDGMSLNEFDIFNDSHQSLFNYQLSNETYHWMPC